jgi:CheY-like chemotaxis protein
MYTAVSFLDAGLYPFNTCPTDAYIPEVAILAVDQPGKDAPQILIVEDEAILAMCLQDKLAELGYGIPVAVSSGEQAVQAAQDYHPDLVLMDIKLNGQIDGVEAARQIREQADIPVVFMSAYSDLETLQRALLTSSAGFLVKPVRMESLDRLIKEVLSQTAPVARRQ